MNFDLPHHPNFPSPTPATWDALDTPARVAAVRAHIALGHPAAVIASRLSTTRHAITGFCRRNGVTLPAWQFRRSRATSLPVLPPLPAEVWALAPSHVTGPPVAFLDLEDHHCRWPVGADEDRTFCGSPRKRGSYCAHHAGMAFTPPRAPLGYDQKRMGVSGPVEPGITAADAASLVVGRRKMEGME